MLNIFKKAVLVAIAIPVFTTQLERSRESTDMANVRSAYAEVVAAYFSDNDAHSATVTLQSNTDSVVGTFESIGGVSADDIIGAGGTTATVAVDAEGNVTINGNAVTSSVS